jgi:ketosteroid isomerase-like protein
MTVDEVVAAYFDRLNGENWDGLMELFHEDAELTAPSNTWRGRSEIGTYYRRTLAAFPEHLDQPGRVIASGDTAAVEIAYEGRMKDGREIRFDAVDIFDVQDGRIRRLTTWYDSAAVRKLVAAK